jgi:dolichyl-phosphate-mannose-protein mannosyltransferase
MKKRVWTVVILFTMVLVVAPQVFAEENLLRNGDFEQGPITNPVNWRAENGATDAQSYFGLTDKKVHGGKYALMIKSDNPNDARMFQTVNVKPNTYYRFSGWIATENVATDLTGAILSLWGIWDTTPTLNGTLDWTYRELNFKTHASQNQVELLARLGMWGNVVTGTAYFDDLSLTELTSAPPAFAKLIAPGESNSNQPPKSGINLWLILILLIIIIGVVK